MNYDKFDGNHEAETYAKGKHNPVWVLYYEQSCVII